ncbi:MAG: hypothetical protein WCA29_02480 [Jiangellales bacterium]
MSFQQKNSWATVAALVLAYGWYVVIVLTAASHADIAASAGARTLSQRQTGYVSNGNSGRRTPASAATAS